VYCTKCGAKNDNSSVYCHNCGNKLIAAINNNDEIENTQEIEKMGMQEVANTIEDVEEIKKIEDINTVEEIEEAGKIESEEEVKEEVKDLEAAALAEKKDEEVNNVNEPVRADTIPPKKSKSKIVISLVVLVFISAALLLAYGMGFFNGKGSLSPVVYMKGNELLVRDIKDEKSQTISNEVFDDDDLLNEYLSSPMFYNDEEYQGFTSAQLNNDGRSLFYLSNVDLGGETLEGNLYLKDITGKKESIRIASHIFPFFEITPDGKRVLYLKNFNDSYQGDLYLNDLEKETKVANEISHFKLSDNGEYVLFGRYHSDTMDWDYYLKSLKDDSYEEKIDSNIYAILNRTPNFEKIYYTKLNNDDGTENLYLKEKNQDKVKLIGDSSKIHSVEEDGSVIYYKSYKETFDLQNIVNDDMKAQDAEIVYPNIEDYFLYNENYYWYSYPVYDEESYDLALEKYYEKEFRDYIRKYIQENPMELTKEELFVYKDGESKKIDNNVAGVQAVGSNGAIAYYKYLDNKIEKLNISEIDSEYYLTEYFWNNIFGKSALYMYTVKDGSKLLLSQDQDEYRFLTFAEDLNSFYLLDKFNFDRYTGKLVKYDVSNMASFEAIADDVSSFTLFPNDEILYFKDIKEGTGELYFMSGKRNEKIADDVSEFHYIFDENEKLITCLDNYSTKNETGRLVIISNYEKTVIADDVNYFLYRSPQDILYFKNYSKSRNNAELWHYNGDEENIRLDFDVTKIIS
jgi:hypothetical protein